jgi:hypothetical protein
VVDEVLAAREVAHEVGVTDVAFDKPDRALLQRPGEVVAAAPDEVVQDDDLLGTRDDQLVDEVGADRTATTGDENALAMNAAG